MLKFFPQSETSRFNAILEHLRTPLFRNGYALIFSTGITSLLGFLFWTIAARVYETENVGINSALIPALTFLSSIAQLNLQETMIRFIPQAGKQTLRLVLSTYAIVITLSVVVGLIFCLGISIWSPALGFVAESPASIAWFVFALVLWGIFIIQDSVLMGLRQALWIPFENAVSSVLKIILLVVLASAFPRDGIFIASIASIGIMIIPVSYLIFGRLIPQYSRQDTLPNMALSVRQISKYVAGNYLVALCANMSSTLLPILIIQISGAEANAYFYIAWILASTLQIAAANMSTSLTVEGAANVDLLEEHRRRALMGIARIVIPLAAILIIGAPLILRVLGADYSDNATVLMQLLALSAIPNIYNMVYVGLARVQNRIVSVVLIYAANAALVLGLSLVLLPVFGITGVGMAWLISQSLIALVLFLLPKPKNTL